MAERILFTAALIFLALMVVMVNIKTTIFAVFLVGGFLILNFMLTLTKVRFFGLAILLPLIGVIFINLTIGFVTEDQLDLLFLRFESSDSLDSRYEVYWNVVEFFFNRPLSFLFGVGPGLTNRYDVSQDLELGRVLAVSGGTEGAIDSTYLTFMFEYGVVTLGIVIYVVAEAVFKLRRSINWTGWSTAKDVHVVIFYWAVAAATQLSGISKSAWLLAQVIGLAHCLVRCSTRARIQAIPVEKVI